MSSASSSSRRKHLPAIGTFVSIAGLFVLWHVISQFSDQEVFPPPLRVLEFIIAETRSGELLWHLAITLSRVIVAFLVSIFIGTAIGLALGSSQTLNRIFDPWVVLFLNIPALVIIVLAYIWFGLNEAAAIGAVALNKIPNVIVTMREGARAMDPAYGELAKVYRFSKWETFANVTLPQLQPFLAAASRSGISLIWKIVLVVELLGRSNGVGFQIHLYFQLFDVAAILGYTLAFVAIMLAVELLVLQPYEKTTTRWRRQHA